MVKNTYKIESLSNSLIILRDKIGNIEVKIEINIEEKYKNIIEYIYLNLIYPELYYIIKKYGIMLLSDIKGIIFSENNNKKPEYLHIRLDDLLKSININQDKNIAAEYYNKIFRIHLLYLIIKSLEEYKVSKYNILTKNKSIEIYYFIEKITIRDLYGFITQEKSLPSYFSKFLENIFNNTIRDLYIYIGILKNILKHAKSRKNIKLDKRISIYGILNRYPNYKDLMKEIIYNVENYDITNIVKYINFKIQSLYYRLMGLCDGIFFIYDENLIAFYKNNYENKIKKIEKRLKKLRDMLDDFYKNI